MTPPEEKPWALLAYMVADDKGGLGDTDMAVRRELPAIFGAGDLAQIHVALQVDFKRTAGVFRARIATRKPREFIPIDAKSHPVWRPVSHGVAQSELLVEEEKTDLNAATVGVLKEFLQYGRRECPAKRYVIFFYGHAFGPMGLFYDSGLRQDVPNTLRLTELAEAMQSHEGPAEIVLFRDCFMGTLETAFQLQGVARFMIATQAEAPIAGTWQWLPLIQHLKADADSAAVAAMVASGLGDYHDKEENRGPFADVPWSLLDIGAVPRLKGPLKALVEALTLARHDAEQRTACGAALEGARRGHPGDHANPGDPALLDVQTMCENLQQRGNRSIASAAKDLGDIARTEVVKHLHSQKGVFTGLSIYYKPLTTDDFKASFIQADSKADITADEAYYKTLALSRSTGWDRIALNPLGAV